MVIIYLILYSFFLLLTWLKNKTIIKPNIIFNTMWCLGGALVSIGYAGLNSPSKLTHFLICSSIIIFNLSYIFLNSNLPKGMLYFNIKQNEVKWTMLYLCNMLAYLFMVPILIKAINIIQTAGWFALRDFAYQGSDILATTLELRVVAWIINPIFTCTNMISAIYAIHRIKKIPLYAMTIINLTLITLSFGGRFTLVRTILYYLFAFLILKSMTNEKIIIRKKYIIIGIGLFFLLVHLTKLRGLKGLNFFQNGLVYFFGSLVYFDVLVNVYVHESMMWGKGVLGFLLNPIIYIGGIILGKPNATSEYIFNEITRSFVIIGEGIKYNAMPSALFPFWMDGKYIGVFFGMFIFALITVLIEKKLYIKRNTRYYLLYIYMWVAVFTSVMKYDLLSIQSFMTILSILLFTRSAKTKNNNSKNTV